MKSWIPHRLKLIVSFQESPHKLALAFGFGVFLGIIPGTGAIAAAVCASVLRLNLPMMVTGALLTNPFTAPFVYLSSFLLGQWILGKWLPPEVLPRLLLGTVAGNLILAFCLGVIGYGVVFGVTLLIRMRQEKRQVKGKYTFGFKAFR